MKAKSRQRSIYVCTSCGKNLSRWMGKCPDCEEWNTIIEEKLPVRKGASSRVSVGDVVSQTIDQCRPGDQAVVRCGIDEFDNLLGGGLAPESSILIGGEPGIGKSTLILQVVAALACKQLTSLYLSGEESVQQVALRGKRIGTDSDQLHIGAVRELPQIYHLLDKVNPAVVVIDSVQTLYDPDLESAPGTISQIRSAAAELIDSCKRRGMILILIGHITKDGAIAGPKVLEHLVDAVLYFEGEQNNLFRILRVKKNRFGPTAEIGIFQIGESGLTAVANPSELFLNEYPEEISGRAVVSVVEGQRPLLLEMQALVTQTNFGYPQRVASGFDLRRLSLLLAILEKREKIELGQKDVFINLAGGLKVFDPALDLGVIAAVMSSVEDIPVKARTVVIGEAGLSGEVRAVPYIESRVREAVKLGFERVIIPRQNAQGLKGSGGIEVVGVSNLRQLAKEALS